MVVSAGCSSDPVILFNVDVVAFTLPLAGLATIAFEVVFGGADEGLAFEVSVAGFSEADFADAGFADACFGSTESGSTMGATTPLAIGLFCVLVFDPRAESKFTRTFSLSLLILNFSTRTACFISVDSGS